MNEIWSSILGKKEVEQLAIVVFFPRHFKGEKMEPAALLSLDQLNEASLSSVRLNWSCPREIADVVVAPARIRKPNVQTRGIMIAPMKDIEDIVTATGTQAFTVVADGFREMPGHAHIGFAQGAPSDRNNQKILRHDLIETFLHSGGEEALHPTDVVCSWIRSARSSHPISPLHYIS